MANHQYVTDTLDQRQLVEQLAIYLFENNPHSNNRTKWKPTWPDIGCNVRGTWRKKARQTLSDLKGNGHTIAKIRNFICASIRKANNQLKYIDIESDSIERANLEGQHSIALTIKQIIGGET